VLNVQGQVVYAYVTVAFQHGPSRDDSMASAASKGSGLWNDEIADLCGDETPKLLCICEF